MIRHGQKGYFVGGKVVGQGEHDTKMYWSSRERSLSLDGRPVRKLTDYLGVLRTVVFCTEDLQLVKGVGRARRRFLDLLLSQTYPAYLPLLQRYTRALRSRNALLRQPGPDPAALDGFSRELVKAGEEIMRLRRSWFRNCRRWRDWPIGGFRAGRRSCGWTIAECQTGLRVELAQSRRRRGRIARR